MNDFVDYVYDFYGKGGLYADFFKNFDKPVTKEEIAEIAAELAKGEMWGDGDSVDREMVRDTLFRNRNVVFGLEYNV